MSDQGRLVSGRYRLAEMIGRGGMGTVWRAEDELLARQVAVKKLRVPPQLHDDERETLYERTRREARSAARITHPNVVVVHDVVEDEGLPCIVMEYVQSRTLGDVLKNDGPITPREAARIGRGMVAALRAAHRAGVLHRDVKPANVLLGLDEPEEDDSWPGGRIVLTDFGIASATGTSTLTRTGELIGSFDYLAPERITGGSPGPASDLWALGATLYQAVEGVAPFHRDTPIETAYAIAAEAVPPSRNAGPLAPVISSLLEKDPERRMSAAQVERLLVSSVKTVLTNGTPPRGVPAAGAQGPRTTPSWATGEATAEAARAAAAGEAATDATGTTGTTGATASTGALGAAEGPTEVVPRQAGAPGEPAYAPGADAYTGRDVVVPEPRPVPDQETTAPTARSAGPATATTTGLAAVGTGGGDDTTAGTGAAGQGGSRRRARRRGPRVLLWTVAALVLVAGLGTGGLLLARHRGDDHAGGSPGGGSPAPSTPAPTPKPTAPAGYHFVNDKAMFSVAVPNGWVRDAQSNGTEIDYAKHQGDTAFLRISIENFAGPSPLQHWQDLQKTLQAHHNGYSLLRMNATSTTVNGVQEPAAIWEFTWNGPSQLEHAIDLGFGQEGGTEYAVYVQAPDADWANWLPVFETAIKTFRPTS
ncbi:serine/threonine-protein kinase [Streptantibioticus parmotrematis]|nr:serine/threonine-protein kinase [Streptantibioticus parmotrematis]